MLAISPRRRFRKSSEPKSDAALLKEQRTSSAPRPGGQGPESREHVAPGEETRRQREDRGDQDQDPRVRELRGQLGGEQEPAWHGKQGQPGRRRGGGTELQERADGHDDRDHGEHGSRSGRQGHRGFVPGGEAAATVKGEDRQHDRARDERHRDGRGDEKPGDPRDLLEAIAAPPAKPVDQQPPAQECEGAQEADHPESQSSWAAAPSVAPTSRRNNSSRVSEADAAVRSFAISPCATRRPL